VPTATSRSPQHPHGRRYDGQVVVYAFPRLAVGTQDGRLSLAHEGSRGRYQVYRRGGPGQARRPSASASAPASGSVPVAGAAAVASTAARLLLTERVLVLKPDRPAHSRWHQAVPQRPHGRRDDGRVVVYPFPRLAVGAQGRLYHLHTKAAVVAIKFTVVGDQVPPGRSRWRSLRRWRHGLQQFWASYSLSGSSRSVFVFAAMMLGFRWGSSLCCCTGPSPAYTSHPSSASRAPTALSP
jgi:hypothetical protein